MPDRLVANIARAAPMNTRPSIEENNHKVTAWAPTTDDG